MRFNSCSENSYGKCPLKQRLKIALFSRMQREVMIMQKGVSRSGWDTGKGLL
jgi:hypothetical protein